MRHNYWFDVTVKPFYFNSEMIPLNLCHLGIYLIPLCLITGNRKLAVFTVINSVMGGIFAFVFPAVVFNHSISDVLSMHFLFNHIMLIILPNLMFKFKLFENVKFSDIKGLFKYNVIYYLTVCLANTVLPNFLSGVSYFGGNKDTAFTITPLIPGSEKLLNFVLSFDVGTLHFEIYYLWWLTLFVAMCLLCTLFGYVLYRLIRKIDHTK